MRKMIILAMTLISWGNTNAETVTTKTYARSSNGCSGNGICSVTTTSNNTEGHITTTWTLSADHRTLTMLIPEASRSEVPEDVMDLLLSGEFVMEAEFVFPIDIAMELGSVSAFTIPMGTFPVSHSSSGFSVEFSLVQ